MKSIFQGDDNELGGDEAGAGDLDRAVALQNALQEDIDANMEGAVGSSEPQPSTSGYVPVAAPPAPPAPSQSKVQDKDSTSDSGKGNSSYESMVRI